MRSYCAREMLRVHWARLADHRHASPPTSRHVSVVCGLSMSHDHHSLTSLHKHTLRHCLHQSNADFSPTTVCICQCPMSQLVCICTASDSVTNCPNSIAQVNLLHWLLFDEEHTILFCKLRGVTALQKNTVFSRRQLVWLYSPPCPAPSDRYVSGSPIWSAPLHWCPAAGTAARRSVCVFHLAQCHSLLLQLDTSQWGAC